LSGDEKKRFEAHLLECDACFQEIYEFSPVVATIDKNMKRFRNATKKSVMQDLRERIPVNANEIKQFFQGLFDFHNIMRTTEFSGLAEGTGKCITKIQTDRGVRVQKV
jgi:hypothetical protein